MIHLLFLRSFPLKFSFIQKKYLTSFCLRTSFSFCNKCWKDLWCLSRLKNVKNLYIHYYKHQISHLEIWFFWLSISFWINIVRNDNLFYIMFWWCYDINSYSNICNLSEIGIVNYPMNHCRSCFYTSRNRINNFTSFISPPGIPHFTVNCLSKTNN